MLSTKLKEAAGNSADATLYVNDVFSTYLYTGNGSTQTITNGIDLAGKGGLVWWKGRSAGAAYSHLLFDTNRGVNTVIVSNGSGADISLVPSLTSFNSNGFAIGGTGLAWNGSGESYVSWTFREAAKFFDVVTYTGTGSARTIAHSLGVAPGMVIVKRTDTSGDWQVYHRSLTSAANSIQLNLTAAEASAPTVWNSTAPTSSVFSVGTDATVNASGGTYVAYLFAHDTAADGIIQCGSFTADGSGNATVNLGYEPQWMLVRRTSSASDWQIIDTMRGWPVNTNGLSVKELEANMASAETNSFPYSPNATGFTLTGVGAGNTFIYMAIRMPNKPPTTGTQVYNAIARTGNASTTSLSVGFAPDLVMDKGRDGRSGWLWDKLRGVSKYLSMDLTNSDMTIIDSILSFDNLGITVGTDTTGSRINGPYPYSNWFFKRAPGFFDEVCYTGTGVATTQAHNLGVVPELMIVKSRSNVYDWEVYNVTLGNDSALNLNAAGAAFTTGGIAWNYTTPTSTVFSLGNWVRVNGSGYTFVAYLFATLAGISKVGSYTGNGTSQNIECGFAAGARFFLVKATSTTGSWWVWDSARGITSGNDPALQLNSTAAEITTADAVDPYSPGITVNQEANCSINASGVSYIFLAVA